MKCFNRKSFWLFISFVCLTFFIVPGVNADNEECNLRCWLRSMVVEVPPISLGVLTGSFNITNLTIWNTEIEKMDSEWYPDPSAATSNAILLSAEGATLNMSAVWSFSLTSGANPLTGTLATWVEKSKMELAFQFDRGDDGLINKVSSPKCNTDLHLGDIKFTGDLEWILEHAANLLKDTLLGVVDKIVCQEIPGLVETNFTQLFLQANDLIRKYWNATEPLVIPVPDNSIDIRTSPVFNSLDYALNKLIGANGPLNLTYLVGIFSNGTGTVSMQQFTNKSFSFVIPVPSLNANITLGINDVIVSHLDTWNEFRLLDPISEHVLKSFTDLADLGINVSFFVNVSVAGDMINDTRYLYEEAWINTYMDSNTLTLLLQVAPKRGVFSNYSDKMCLTPQCDIASIEANGTAVIFTAINMSFEYIEMIATGAELEADVRKVVNSICAVFINNYKFAIPPFVNGIINDLGLSYANQYMDDAINETSCPYEPNDPYDEVNYSTTFPVLGAAVTVSLLVAFYPLCMHFKSKANEQQEKQSLIPSDAGGINNDEGSAANHGTFANAGSKDVKGFWANFRRTDAEGASFYMDKRINVWVRAFVPLLLFVNAAMFVSSNTSIGASVFVYLTFADQREIRLPSMFDFGLINSVVDMWKAGVYPLSILVAVFSGIWPYTKLVMMLFVWILPASVMPRSTRVKWLTALDVLGKWSLLDSYIMIMMLVAFHFHIEFPSVEPDYLKQPTVVDLFVYPAYGFLLLMISTIMSLFTSHVMMFIERKIEGKDNGNNTPEAARKRSLFLYCTPKHCVIPVRILVTLMLLATAAMFAAGIAIESFEFDFKGLAGWAMEFMNVSTHSEYSILSLATEIPPSARYPDSATIRFTQGIFIFVTVAVPLLHILSLNIVWFVPMTRKWQNIFYDACEIMYAWSCMDVFVVSIMAAVLEISQFAVFMVGDKCDFLTPILDKYFVDILGEYNSCFQVIAVLDQGCWILFSAVIFYTIVSNVFMRVCRDAIEARGKISSASSIQQSSSPSSPVISDGDKYLKPVTSSPAPTRDE